jgi:hypothetical protein
MHAPKYTVQATYFMRQQLPFKPLSTSNNGQNSYYSSYELVANIIIISSLFIRV